MNNAPIAQMVELLTLNQNVPGSSPGGSTGLSSSDGSSNGLLIRGSSVRARGEALCGRNSIGRVPRFQRGGCEFESRRPLQVGLAQWKSAALTRQMSGVRIPQPIRSVSSARSEQSSCKRLVGGSNPSRSSSTRGSSPERVPSPTLSYFPPL